MNISCFIVTFNEEIKVYEKIKMQYSDVLEKMTKLQINNYVKTKKSEEFNHFHLFLAEFSTFQLIKLESNDLLDGGVKSVFNCSFGTTSLYFFNLNIIKMVANFILQTENLCFIYFEVYVS